MLICQLKQLNIEYINYIRSRSGTGEGKLCSQPRGENLILERVRIRSRGSEARRTRREWSERVIMLTNFSSWACPAICLVKKNFLWSSGLSEYMSWQFESQMSQEGSAWDGRKIISISHDLFRRREDEKNKKTKNNISSIQMAEPDAAWLDSQWISRRDVANKFPSFLIDFWQKPKSPSLTRATLPKRRRQSRHKI